MNKLDYLEFELNCRMMNATARRENRKKYGITEEDLIKFYGENYPGKRKTRSIKVKSEKKKNKFKDEEIEEQLDLFKKIFDNEDEAFIRIFCKKTHEFYSYPIKALLDKDKLFNILNSHRFSTINDLMYTLNTYNNMKRMATNNIFTINSFAIDVDFKDVIRFAKHTPKQVIKILEKTEFDKSVPKPNVIEYGNNLRLIYILDKVYSNKDVTTLVRRICNYIGERLVDYGAKGQPLTTFGRVLNSVNSKNGKRIKAMYLGQPKYILRQLQEKVLPPLPDWYAEYKIKSGRKKAKIIDFSKDFSNQAKSRKYNENRISDIFKIVEYFDGDIDGRRFLCFQIRNHAKLAGYTNEEAEQLMKELNNKFKRPLRWNVIEQDTRNVERKQYYYKSQTFLDYISITPELEELLELKGFLSKTEIKRRDNVANKARQKAKYRNKEGLTKTEVKRRNEFIFIARLEIQGVSYKSIAKSMNKDLSNMLKRLKKRFDKINYNEILEEVKLGVYDNLQETIG
ncbi:hypothetical protein ACSXCD_14920 (plasmid) [Clostridium perfringens]|uniref:hypothetical protein n=1 Tax=Clostridium perfringens TaxID=1502 RepID=UPI0018E4CBFF|nr:hypothetical protein [Clostridium perfringens]MBI6010400.1 hypothetical protein [Clostridium perfringens]MCI7268596.1 hypothetical protein [Mollicutes bacterium]